MSLPEVDYEKEIYVVCCPFCGTDKVYGTKTDGVFRCGMEDNYFKAEELK